MHRPTVPRAYGLVCHAGWFLLWGVSDRVIPVAAGRHVLEPCKNRGWDTDLDTLPSQGTPACCAGQGFSLALPATDLGQLQEQHMSPIL